MKSRRSRYFSGLLNGCPSISEGARARLGEVEDEEGEESVEEEDSGETEVADALANAPEQMAIIMGHLSQAAAPRDNFKAHAFKNPSMKEPDSFYGTQAHKLRGFIQSWQLSFHNNPANSFSDRKKVLYLTSFLTGRDGKWIEPYLSNISNEDPSYLLNNWHLFETQLLTPFGDPNEVRKTEQELDNLGMKESGHLSFYIADFRSLMSRIGDWGERAYIHFYRRGLASILLDQLASYPGNLDTFRELMDITLELDTRYRERQKEKGSHKEKKPLLSGLNSSRPSQDSSSKRPHHKENKKGKKFQASKDNPILLFLIRTIN
ncbi:hypothetical protein O181_065245 [Austropuccinia psidii MF-1]|uniref:Ty3 transposon capsid-like protein domain-containing protein n=1 Tax=Austropuccinia psidii MF-1 TaxID=1389203 RepID=A0A9Q3EUQ3_9BASI|nr:hypothetical protein [Austropuccinia psidii MF-1]